MITTNGNYSLEIQEDGTKIRTIPDGVIPNPTYPESIDLKITDNCDLYCPYCHENSTTVGKHGEYSSIENLLNTLPSGTEVAIGGGNPLTHPDIEKMLNDFPELITNLTVNARHLKDVGNLKPTALGISYVSEKQQEIKDFIASHKDIQCVIHLVVGVNTVDELKNCVKDFDRVLILGYKVFGRGIKYYSHQVQASTNEWYKEVGRYLNDKTKVVAFDNLALDELRIKRFFDDETWNRIYMGDEGKFSMYIDMVKHEFAQTSRSNNKHQIGALNIKEMFNIIKNE